MTPAPGGASEPPPPCPGEVVLRARRGIVVDRWPLPAEVDLAVVDALARAQLHARRMACSVELRRPSLDLERLLDLAGLAEVVPTAAAPVLDETASASPVDQVKMRG